MIYIWLLGLALWIAFVGEEGTLTRSYVSKVGTVLLQGGSFALFVWLLIRFVNCSEWEFSKSRRIDPTTVHGVSQVVKIFLGLIGVIVFLQLVGVPLSGVVALGGIGGIGLGLAAKDLLANFFGGLMIFLDRPFQIGDWIRSPDKEIEGNVEHIGWRLTRIRTPDQRPLFVPNSLFSTISIENPSRMSHRRIQIPLSLRYEEAVRVPELVKQIEAMLKTHPDIDQSQSSFARLVSLNPYSLEILVYTFTLATDLLDFRRVHHELLVSILAIVASMGMPAHSLSIPYRDKDMSH
jgi:MscS family membrane protein